MIFKDFNVTSQTTLQQPIWDYFDNKIRFLPQMTTKNELRTAIIVHTA